MRHARIIYLLILPFLSILLSTCKNVDDVSPTNRTTFIKLFEKAGDYAAQVAEPIDNGYIVGSNLTSGNESSSFITKVDVHGNVIWETEIPASSVAAVKVVDDGYLVFGDGIQTNDTALNINDRVITTAMLTKIGPDGGIVKSASLNDPSKKLTDFHGTGVTLDATGNIVTAGNKRASELNALSGAYLAAYNPTTLDTVWTADHSLIDQDNINARNVFLTQSGNFLWSNSVQKTNLTQTLSYLTISNTPAKGNFDNYDFLGQSITQNRLIAEEMQAATLTYGVIGTLADGQGHNGNMFFIQVGPNGSFLKNTLLFFDGITGAVPGDVASLDNVPVSESDDTGRALSATPDGGFLLGGTLTTTIQRGNGQLDIWLVKIDPTGKILWNKIFGGAGSETVNSIRTLPDGSFLIAGGSSSSNLSAAFLMRIDKDGEIKN